MTVAESELADSRSYYEAEQSGLGNRFVQAVYETVRKIVRSPTAGG